MKIGVYKYNGSVCGASFAIPQIAGLFLLSRQIDKDIRFNEFINIIKSPQMVNKDGTNYINASEIIKQVEKNKIEKDIIKKTIFFHDQKSDTFFKDKSTGVYTVPPQEKNTKELGKETFNEQNVSKIAKTIIAILFRDYWATPTQREKIITKEKHDIAKMEQEKREIYNPDDIFKKNNKIQNNNALNQNTAIIEYKEESPFKKLLNRIMIFLHIKK